MSNATTLPVNPTYFWSKVDKSGPGQCWSWTGYRTPAGYGKTNGALAHRVAYELTIGPIPAGLDLDHLCRVRHCVNPEHLEAVDHHTNVRRGSQATATHCQRGHVFDEANTYITPAGWRYCRACHAARHRQYRKEGRIR